MAVGLSMDAFAVSVTNGMCIKNAKSKQALACGLCFGLFQGLMPVIGFLLGKSFESLISKFDHWIALIFLSFIGIKMIVDSIKGDDDEACDVSGGKTGLKLTPSLLLTQGIATSIDALIVGVSFAALSVNIYSAAAFICCVTFAFSFAGVYIGKFFGSKFNNKAQIIGGAILIIIGLKTFIEHVWLS